MKTSDPVKVGVDGSKAGIRAALWAADEAVARDATLDLVYVVDPSQVDDLDDALALAQHEIHRAWTAVRKRNERVTIESEILQGDPVVELATAARHATMLCVGHKGRGNSAPRHRGAVARALIRTSPTSVAVVRRRHSRPPTFHRWVVVMLDESAESHLVLQAALDEAEIRKAPVLILTAWSSSPPTSPSGSRATDLRAKMDRYLRDTLEGTADIQVCALPMPRDVTTILEQSAGIDQLLVVGANRADFIDRLDAKEARSALRGTNCSILVVRPGIEQMVTTYSRGDSAVVAG